MDASVWHCEPPLARLQLDSFQATLDATHPAAGLAHIALPSGQTLDANLLGLDVPLYRPEDAGALLECYAHGMDLVIAYQESALRPFRVDAVWRAIRPAPGDNFLAAVDLIVSVRTDLLDSQPAVMVQSAAAGDKTVTIARARSAAQHATDTAGRPASELGAGRWSGMRRLRVAGQRTELRRE